MSSQRIFQDSNAKKVFMQIYNDLDNDESRRVHFCDVVREAAQKKVESLDDNLEEFYLTANDVENCFNGIPSAY